MKRGIAFILSLFLINFVSAQFFDGYNSFSITGFFDSIGSQDLILLTLFLIFFAFIFLILTRIGLFRSAYGQPNKGIPAVISFAISLLAVYGVYKSNFDLEGSFSGFGFPTDIFYPLLLIILIAGAIFIIWVFGRRKEGFSLSSGLSGLFIISSILIFLITFFTEIIYEKGAASAIALGLLVVGLWLWKKARRGLMGAGKFIGGRYDWQKEKRQASSGGLLIFLGILGIIFGVFLSGNFILIVIGAILTLIGIVRKFFVKRSGYNYGDFQSRNI